MQAHLGFLPPPKEPQVMLELGGAESQRVTREEAVEFIKLIHIQLGPLWGHLNTGKWLPHFGCIRGRLITGIMETVPLALALKPHNLVSTCMSLVPSKPLSLRQSPG